MNSLSKSAYDDVMNQTFVPELVDTGRQYAGIHISSSETDVQYATRFLKRIPGKVALFAFHSPTLLEPVIPVPEGTLIESNLYTFNTDTLPELAYLGTNYQLRNSEEIRSYLAKNEDLFAALDFISNEVSKYDNINSISLEHYKDFEEHWEKLSVVIETDIDALKCGAMERLSELEDNIYQSTFEPQADLIDGRIVLTVI